MHNMTMNWDAPVPSRVFMGAAVVVLVSGWAVTRIYRTPELSAPPQISAVAADEPEVRDAVASPAMPMAAAGWLQASGAAGLSRVAHAPALLNALKPALPSRPSSGRFVFSSARVMEEKIGRGVI